MQRRRKKLVNPKLTNFHVNEVYWKKKKSYVKKGKKDYILYGHYWLLHFTLNMTFHLSMINYKNIYTKII